MFQYLFVQRAKKSEKNVDKTELDMFDYKLINLMFKWHEKFNSSLCAICSKVSLICISIISQLLVGLQLLLLYHRCLQNSFFIIYWIWLGCCVYTEQQQQSCSKYKKTNRLENKYKCGFTKVCRVSGYWLESLCTSLCMEFASGAFIISLLHNHPIRWNKIR